MYINTKTIYIYFHICTIENWVKVVSKLFDKLKTSGLLDLCQEFRVAVLGDQLDLVRQLLEHSKTRIIFHSQDLSLYERPALVHLHQSSEIDEFCAFYFHSKGIRSKNIEYRENISDWVDMMCYFLIDKHQKCLELLTRFEAVGVNFIDSVGDAFLKKVATGHTSENSRHFSGNFWWTRSDYIRSLPSIIGQGYLNPELWIGTGNGFMHSVHQSNIQHYFNRYPPHKYVNKVSSENLQIDPPQIDPPQIDPPQIAPPQNLQIAPQNSQIHPQVNNNNNHYQLIFYSP